MQENKDMINKLRNEITECDECIHQLKLMICFIESIKREKQDSLLPLIETQDIIESLERILRK